jgi:hypothetical protein
MIISTGMRTDIPAFYSEWFCNRLKEGYVCVRNPYNPTSVSKYQLNPDVVDVIGFCTKNPAPMLEHLDLLEHYGQYWFVTITPYGTDIEPNVPAKEKVMEDFKKLSGAVGIDCVGWRYDPIFIDNTYTVERHISDFQKMAANLDGYTKTCVISFIDMYEKVKRNFPQVKPVSTKDRIAIGKAFVEIAALHGMTIKPCGEGNELAQYGADCSGCMTIATYEKAIGCKLNAPKKKGARTECACYLTGDIGQYDTCRHMCRYCYANNNYENVINNMKLHNPKSPLLVGELTASDEIHEVKAASWADRQLSIFD